MSKFKTGEIVMGRPIRDTDPSKIRLITIRTANARFFMKPSKEVEEIIGGVIARYQEVYGILIYAYCVLSNHYHLVLKAPHGNLWRFQQEVNREIAQRINRHLNRAGFFWGRRYDDQEILEPADAEKALFYVVCNPTRHGLVSHPSEWPGASSYRSMLTGESSSYKFTHYTDYQKALRRARLSGEKVRLKDYQTVHQLRLSRLPQFENLSDTEYALHMNNSIEAQVESIKEERTSAGQGFLKVDAILTQNPFSRPKEPSKRIRPLCYTQNYVAKREFMARWFPWIEAYREASRRFRSGNFQIEFPSFSLRPPMHYCFSPG